MGSARMLRHSGALPGDFEVFVVRGIQPWFGEKRLITIPVTGPAGGRALDACWTNKIALDASDPIVPMGKCTQVSLVSRSRWLWNLCCNLQTKQARLTDGRRTCTFYSRVSTLAQISGVVFSRPVRPSSWLNNQRSHLQPCSGQD